MIYWVSYSMNSWYSSFRSSHEMSDYNLALAYYDSRVSDGFDNVRLISMDSDYNVSVIEEQISEGGDFNG